RVFFKVFLAGLNLRLSRDGLRRHRVIEVGPSKPWITKSEGTCGFHCFKKEDGPTSITRCRRIRFGLRLGSPVGGEGFADIDHIIEAAFFVTPDIAFVASGSDQLSRHWHFLSNGVGAAPCT